MNVQQRPAQEPAVQSKACLEQRLAIMKKEIEERKKSIEIRAQKVQFPWLIAEPEAQTLDIKFARYAKNDACHTKLI